MILSRQHAMELLTAYHGQLISVKRTNNGNGWSYELSRLCKSSNWTYTETLIDIRSSYYDLCKHNLPGFDFDYEQSPSAHKQEYTEYLCAEREAKRAKQKNCPEHIHTNSSE